MRFQSPLHSELPKLMFQLLNGRLLRAKVIHSTLSSSENCNKIHTHLTHYRNKIHITDSLTMYTFKCVWMRLSPRNKIVIHVSINLLALMYSQQLRVPKFRWVLYSILKMFFNKRPVFSSLSVFHVPILLDVQQHIWNIDFIWIKYIWVYWIAWGI